MKKLMVVGFAALALMGVRAEDVAYLSETGNDGTAASFVNCATDDATPINDTCFVGTLEKDSLFADYENKDLTPGAVTKNKGTASDDFAFPSVDLAGNPRVVGKAIDIGCYERQPAKGSSIIIR